MKWFVWLDSIQFLDLKIWDFSVRSLVREYGRLFLTRILLRHPVKTWLGINRYRKMKRSGVLDHGAMSPDSWEKDEPSLVGVGFCLKPLDPPCISGRSNHDCLFFERNLHLSHNRIPKCCESCSIRKIGILANASGNHFYVMTSAKDILLDFLLPAIERREFTRGLFTLCRYSFEPFRIALSIAGIEGCLIPFASGDCRDYPTWLRADDGVKNEQTDFCVEDDRRIEAILTSSETANLPLIPYEKKGNIFYYNV